MQKLAVFVVASGLLALRPSPAAVVPDTAPDGQYPWVGIIGGASGTAISPRSVITARHVGASQFTVLGVTYYASERINHPTMDLALLNFDADLPGWHTLGTSAPLGSALTMVGYGDTGRVNADGDGYDVFHSAGVRRASPNTLHFEMFWPDVGPILVSWLTAAGDGALAAGDSGGSFFIGDELVGVSALAFNTTGGALPDYGFASQNGGDPYHASGAVNLTDPDVRAWVLENAIWCAGDFDHDGFVNTMDVLGFLNMWSTGDMAADFNADGSVNTLDVLAFLNAWSAGC
jgi:hypothetical protein